MLDRTRTERSLCYREMYDRLCDRDRFLVNAMEAKLFQLRLRVEHCPRGTLSLPASDASFDEGRIWFHFSPGRGRFILSYFQLWGGGGGLARSPGSRFHVDADCDWRDALQPDGIAARLASYFGRIDDDFSVAIALSSWDAGFWHTRCAATLAATPPSRPAAHDFARQVCQAHLVWIDPSTDWALPEWSLLGRRTKVRAEIVNRYARSIFAGEALCRLCLELSTMGPTGRALAWGASWGRRGGTLFKSPSSAELLRESAAILAAIRDRSIDVALGGATSHFLTSSLMDTDLMGDQRRLALVRSEMTLRLAAALVRKAGEVERKRPHRARLHYRDLMKRYSMLSDFVTRSASFFGVSWSDASAREVLDDLRHCPKRERSTLLGVVDRLSDYGASTALIVAYFSDDVACRPGRLPEVAPEQDSSMVHDQLSDLLHGILASDPPLGAAARSD
jgi:hypothetical protein